jgi:hypothetical protein
MTITVANIYLLVGIMFGVGVGVGVSDVAAEDIFFIPKKRKNMICKN